MKPVDDLTTIDFFQQKIKHNRQQKQTKRFKQQRKRLIIVLFITLLAIIYVASPLSRINSINISGLNHLERQAFLFEAKLKLDDFILLQPKWLILKNLKHNDLIEQVKVKKNYWTGTINLEVTEKQLFGWRYDHDLPYLILKDNTMLELTGEKLKLLPELIYIQGFMSEELQTRLVEAFNQLQPEILAYMTDILQISVSYDDNLIQILMRDKNQVFTSFQTVDVLNYYFDLVSALKAQAACIFIDEITRLPFTSACPVAKVVD